MAAHKMVGLQEAGDLDTVISQGLLDAVDSAASIGTQTGYLNPGLQAKPPLSIVNRPL